MRIKVNKKDVINSYDKIISVGHCNMQYLLRGQDPMYYTCGYYGWNADIYVIDGVAICTGYRPFGSYKMDYKKVKKLEEKARKIWDDYSLEYKTQCKKVNKLLEKAMETAAEV